MERVGDGEKGDDEAAAGESRDELPEHRVVEMEPVRACVVAATSFEHRWCRWRSLYVRDPEGNIRELVCYEDRIE